MQIVKFSGNFCEFLAKLIILAVILMMMVSKVGEGKAKAIIEFKISNQ